MNIKLNILSKGNPFSINVVFFKLLSDGFLSEIDLIHTTDTQSEYVYDDNQFGLSDKSECSSISSSKY